MGQVFRQQILMQRVHQFEEGAHSLQLHQSNYYTTVTSTAATLGLVSTIHQNVERFLRRTYHQHLVLVLVLVLLPLWLLSLLRCFLLDGG